MDSPKTLGLVNGRLLVYDEVRETMAYSAATALLLEDERIEEIGDDRTIADRARQGGEVFDLRRAVVAPGFIDAHVHAFDCAMRFLRVSCLPPAVNRIEVLKVRMNERAATLPRDAWVVGEGYDDMRLAERRHPTRLDLDEAVPEHPAVVTRACGHMSVANSRALALAGIGGNTPDPPGGTVVGDAAGQPTGLLLENAQSLVLGIVPPADRAQIIQSLRRTAQTLLSHGVTTICEALLGAFHPLEPEIWQQALSEEWTGPSVMFLAAPETLEHRPALSLPIIGTKLFADGVVTGRTAAVSEPFEGGEDTGMLMHEPEALAELVEQSVSRGLPVGVHAMGDRAIGSVVSAIEGTKSGHAAGVARPLPRRHRIEHCSLPSDTSLQRMRALAIVPVVQPVFLFAEGEAYRTQLGDDRASRAYPIRTMIQRGLKPVLSSDAPATSWDDPINPWLGIRAAATRRTWAGSQLGTEETVTVGEAMACYTANGASVLALEDTIGRLAIGKRADLLVLPADPLSSPPDDLDTWRPGAVLIGGRVVHGALPDR